MKNLRSDDYLVTKCKFLTALIEAYEFIQRRDAASIGLML